MSMPKRGKRVQKTPDISVQTADSTSLAPEQRIALRAYELWQQRGCPIGSPEQDWEQARAELCDDSQPGKKPQGYAVSVASSRAG